jgi:trehalose 6-phosphate phosphatase
MVIRHVMFSTAGLDAVLFDMDGVVTDTAEAHALAWKRLFDAYLNERAARVGEPYQPFDADRDYHQFVDGVPRYDGVERFLASRGITLPRGDPDDDPGRETICGLGNRENRYFQDWLKAHQVRAFPGTLAFIRQLKGAGLKVALFSSSRNAVPVLRSAGALHLFDALVDGDDLVDLRLPGKPDPAMLLETARRLRVQPARAAIVEDAIAGVEAGVRGGFRVVIGIDRDHNGEALLHAGASLVVGDLDELAGGAAAV